MDRNLRTGHLETRPLTPHVASSLGVLAATFRIFGANLGFIAPVVLIIYLPGHIIYQFAAAAFEIPSSGTLSVLLLNAVDLVLSSLAIPAIVYGLVCTPAIGPSLRWGQRQWSRTLSQQTLVDITVLLYAALLIVPGLIAMVRLAFVPVIVAAEGDRSSQPFERSRQLAKGRMWRILGVLLPLSLVDAAAGFLLLGRISGVDNARVLFSIAECGLAVVSQLVTVATLLLYLDALPEAQKKTAKL